MPDDVIYNFYDWDGATVVRRSNFGVPEVWKGDGWLRNPRVQTMYLDELSPEEARELVGDRLTEGPLPGYDGQDEDADEAKPPGSERGSPQISESSPGSRKYRVYAARWPEPRIWDGAQWTFAYEGDFDTLNSRFPPLPRNTSFIPQLERVRFDADERTERGMTGGDLVWVEYPDGRTQWWIYDAMPPEGGFTPISRSDHLARIERGLST